MRPSTKELGIGLFDDLEPTRIQIIGPKPYDDLQKPKLCSQCSKPIHLIAESQRWICYNCQLTWQVGFDTPLSDNDTSIRPLQGETAVKPFFKNVGKPYTLQSRATDDEELQIRGSYRKCWIKTTDLGAVTEDRIRKYFDEMDMR